VRRASPLAIDNFVVVIGVLNVSWLHVGNLGFQRTRTRGFNITDDLLIVCSKGDCRNRGECARPFPWFRKKARAGFVT
jgi:hypothetical protein